MGINKRHHSESGRQHQTPKEHHTTGTTKHACNKSMIIVFYGLEAAGLGSSGIRLGFGSWGKSSFGNSTFGNSGSFGNSGTLGNSGFGSSGNLGSSGFGRSGTFGSSGFGNSGTFGNSGFGNSGSFGTSSLGNSGFGNSKGSFGTSGESRRRRAPELQSMIEREIAAKRHRSKHCREDMFEIKMNYA